jgi:large subunit ribosomal protein L18e
MKGKKEIAVIVGPVTDDNRNGYEISNGIRVCALRYTASAHHRINNACGKCMSFDQLALISPTGSNCLLIRGRKNSREVFKHFRKSSNSNNKHVRPYVRHFGRKFEKARGRR